MQGVLGRGLTRQRTVQVNLQDARELTVKRRRRPRQRTLDDRLRDVGRNGQGVGETRMAIETSPRGKLPGPFGALQHLLRGREVLHEGPRLVGLLRSRVDRELCAAKCGRGAPFLTRHRRDSKASGDRRFAGPPEQRRCVRPVTHECRSAVLEGKPDLLLLPRQHSLGDNAIAEDRVAHEGECAHASRRVNDDGAMLRENGTSESRKMLEEDSDEPFVPGALPDEASGHVAGLDHA